MNEHTAGRIQTAVDTLVRDFGPGVTASPGRVRAVLTDLLAEDSRPLRAEIDALVAAAGQGIAAAALAGPVDEGALADQLAGHGVAPDLAALAVGVWARARGPEATALPPVAAAALPPPSATALPAPSGDGRRRPAWSRRARNLVAGGIGAALLLTSSVVVLAGRGGEHHGATSVKGAVLERQPVEQGATSTSATTPTMTAQLPPPDSTATSTATTTSPPPLPRTTTTTTTTTRLPTTTTTGRTTTTTAAGAPTNPAPANTTTTTAAAATTTVPPTTTTTVPPPVAVNDSYAWTPLAENGTWDVARLTVLDNDGGTYDWVDVVTSPVHGNLVWNPAYGSRGDFDYTPHHNGYFTDTFQYRLRNTKTGQVSNVATVYLTVYCNTAYACLQ